MKTVVGLFDQFEEAQGAVQALRDANFPADQINMIASDQGGRYAQYLQGDVNQKQDVKGGAGAGAGIGAVLGGLGGLLVGLGALAIPGIGPVIAAGPIVTTLAGAGVGAVAGGIVGALVDLGIPEEHAKMYAEGIRRGGTLVTVQSEDQRAHEAEDILNQFHPVDVNQRSQNWNDQGQPVNQNQANYQQTSRAIPVTGSDQDNDMDDAEGFNTNATNMNARDLNDDQDSDIPVTGGQPDMTIPVVEEELRVGKRQVDTGGVRVDTNVTEEPVQEDINLHQERVNVERRPVDRPATDEDFNAFNEGTVELHETHEEPVVEKRARVVEEVHVNKDVTDETKTIQDTVRRKDVNVTPVGDWNNMNQGFQQHYQSNFSDMGGDYSNYQPAYRFGYDLASNPQYQGYDWSQMEPIARQNWQHQGMQGDWQDMKDAVRYAWERASNQ